MTKEEYISNKVGMSYSKQLQALQDKIINYLQTNSKNISIELKSLELKEMIGILKGTIDTDNMELVSVDNGIKLRHYNGKIDEILKQYISKQVKTLTVPNNFIKGLDLREYPDLTKLTLTGGQITFDKKALDKLLKSKLKELDGFFKVGDDIKEESTVIGDNWPTLEYKGLTVRCGNLYEGEYTCVYNKKVYENLDKILKFTRKEVSKITNLHINDQFEGKEEEKRVIALEHKKVGDYDFDTGKKYDKEYNILNFYKVNNIEDILKSVEIFKQNGFNVDKLVLNLQNKDYDNIHLLKKLEREHELAITYETSYKKTSLNDFIAMRMTINYYKDLIESANLSNLEKITYAYDIIKSFKYQEAEHAMDSRSIHSIIREGKIVCVGYSVFLSQLLKELGIESYAISTSVPVKDGFGGHERNMINVKDEKYGLDGFYAFDATWDCAHGVVKFIDSEGNTKFKSKERIKDGEQIIKAYDDIVLYRHFLVPGKDYQKVFQGEKMPKLEYASHYDTEKYNTNIEDTNSSFMISHGLSSERLMQLIKTVRLHEGYDMSNIEETLKDIAEVNRIPCETLNEVEIKR